MFQRHERRHKKPRHLRKGLNNEKHHLRRPTAITLALCVALAGCGSSTKASTPAHAVKPIDSQCTDGGTTHGFYECVITLQDTRKVDCVVYAWEKQGGLSCDWDHVSGADKEPAR